MSFEINPNNKFVGQNKKISIFTARMNVIVWWCIVWRGVWRCIVWRGVWRCIVWWCCVVVLCGGVVWWCSVVCGGVLCGMW